MPPRLKFSRRFLRSLTLIAALALMAGGLWRWFPLAAVGQMSLQEFSRDIVPIVQLVMAGLGLISLMLVWWQIRESRLWNRFKSTHNFLNVELVRRLESDVLQRTAPLGVSVQHGLQPADVAKIEQAPEAVLSIKALLNDVENLCAAYQIGFIDRDCAYSVHSARVLRLFRIFEPFIQHVRATHGDDDIYIELEKTAIEWRGKEDEVRAAHQAKLNKLKALEAKQRGVAKKA